jgi:CHASE2 domain
MPGHRTKLLPEHIWKALGESLLALGLLVWDPKGLGRQLDEWIDRETAMATQFFHTSAGRDKLAIVRIDQDTLDTIEQDWPLTFPYMARIAHQIACHGATAIFFDFTLAAKYNLAGKDDFILDMAEDSDKFATAPCSDSVSKTNAKRKVAVFFPKLPGVQSALQDTLDRSGHTFIVQFDAGYNVYPSGSYEFPDAPPTGTDLTPAFGLFKWYCDARSGDLPPDTIPCPGGEHPVYPTAPIFLTWDGNANPDQMSITDSPECNETNWPILNHIRIAAAQMIWSSKEKRCRPILGLSGKFLFGYFPQPDNPEGPASMLNKRIVFVGAELAGIEDRYPSPVHGRIPGVYAHAVALDNLFTYGRRYMTIPAPLTKWTIYGIFLLGVNIMYESDLKRRKPVHRPNRTGIRRLVSSLSNFLWIRRWVLVWVILLAIIVWQMNWPASFLITPVLYMSAAGGLYTFVEPYLDRLLKWFTEIEV